MVITWKCDVVKGLENTPYDLILGRDLLKELKIDVLSSDLTIQKDHIKIPWKPRNDLDQFNFDSENLEVDQDDSGSRLKKILEAKYEPANLDEIVAQSDLNNDQKIKLLKLLQKYEKIFDGTLGTFEMEPYNIELADGATLFHLKRAYTVPQAYEQRTRTEAELLCKLRILKEINDSEWTAGTFKILKKYQTV